MELNDVLKLVGFGEATEETTVEQVKEHLDKKFLSKDTAHESPDVQSKIIGKHFNRLRSGMQKAFEVDEDFIKNEEGELLDPVDAFSKISEKVTNDIAEIKKQSAEGTDKRVLDLQEKLEQSQKSFKDVRALNTELSGKLEDSEKQFNSELEKFKINTMVNDLEGGLNVIDDLQPALKRGIKSELKEDHKWLLDDEGALQVRDKDGNIIPSKEHASTPATPIEVITGIYEKNKALIKNGAKKKEEKERFETKKVEGSPTIAKRKDVRPA